MSTALKNNESLEQINLAQWSIQNTKPDLHLMGHGAAKLTLYIPGYFFSLFVPSIFTPNL